MKMLQVQGRRRERGYTLAETMIVVGIIGVLSLVSIPAFMNYTRQAKLRAATREINGVLRAVRSRAITQSTRMAFSFAAGTAPTAPLRRGQYAIYSGVLDTSVSPPVVNWTQFGDTHYLDRSVYLLDSDFAVDSAVDDTLHDIVFLPNGTVGNIPAGVGEQPNVEIKSDYHLPNNHVKNVFSAPGFFKTTLTTD
jgi:prepilin-type N-terminal cleavage/methylation domain-containing protein